MTPATASALSGALAMAALVAGLFFLRFWRQTRDRLFGSFFLAFWALGIHWFLLALARPEDEPRHGAYVIRLFAYLLIIAGILDKNRRQG